MSPRVTSGRKLGIVALCTLSGCNAASTVARLTEQETAQPVLTAWSAPPILPTTPRSSEAIDAAISPVIASAHSATSAGRGSILQTGGTQLAAGPAARAAQQATGRADVRASALSTANSAARSAAVQVQPVAAVEGDRTPRYLGDPFEREFLAQAQGESVVPPGPLGGQTRPVPAMEDPFPAPQAAPATVAHTAACTLDLSNVLYLTDSQNPNVAFARERINEAYARVDRADALWLPSIRAGLSYNRHEGNLQSSGGNVVDVNRNALYGGFGAGAVGAGSPMAPGVVAQFHVSDAIFQPRIAAHQAASRQYNATATRNNLLRDAAVAYWELVRAEQARAVTQEALDNTARLADLTGNYARTGQGLQSDHERMLTELTVRQTEIASCDEAIGVASARLAQLLHADPSCRIGSGEPMVVAIDMLGECGTANYVSTGLVRRPELAEQKQLVCEAVERLNREKYAPLVPSVLLGFSYGGMGGGLGGSIGHGRDRWDADAIAFWEVRNLGIGERSARQETSSLVRQAQMRQVALLDQVAREVVEAHTQVLERQKRVAFAKGGITAAERSYELNQSRIENAQGLPIEVLQSVQALQAARLNYLNAVIDYNNAQFELCRAIGWFQEC